MKQSRQVTGIIEREGDGYVSLCPELDIASQGNTIEEARSNLVEALELFFETASPTELESRLRSEDLHHAHRGSGWLGYAWQSIIRQSGLSRSIFEEN